MTAKEFEIFWTSAYPGTVPIPLYFRHDCIDRWFRIHSLPDSKRYAEGKEEWDILLERQNTILTDLLGTGESFLLVTGDYEMEAYAALPQRTGIQSIENIPFIWLSPVGLHNIDHQEYESGHVYKPRFSEQFWYPDKFNDLLKDVAIDELRVFFVSIRNHCIAAPYDGGVDFIVKDQPTKEALKRKYSAWLSGREDGL